MDEKTNKEASGEQEDNLSDLNASFPTIKASQEILYNMSRIYLSPQLMNLNRTIQEVGKSMYKVTTSPAMEQLANLNQVFVVDSTFKFYDSSVIESVARINQQMAETISIIPHLPAIKNMTSGQTLGPMPNEISYALSKGALKEIVKSLAHDLANKNITVNAINPGLTNTGYLDGHDLSEWIETSFPFGRLSDPQDTANLITFLLSDKGSWITGQIINSEGRFVR